MGYFPRLVSCRLIRLNPRRGRAEENVLSKDREGEYVQGEYWTVVVGLNQLQNFRHNNNW